MSKPTSDRRATERKHPWPMVRLGDVCDEIKDRIQSSKIAVDEYVTTDNMVKDRCGIVQAEYVPSDVGLIEYHKGDVLIANIRPYLKKIWLADHDGGCSSDVVVFRTNTDELSSEYLYSVLSQDAYFEYVMQKPRGAKMPRGDRDWMKEFRFPLPPLSVQREIVARLERELAAEEKMKKGFEALAETAKDEFKAELKEVFEELKHRGTEMRKLGDVCECKKGPFGSVLTKSMFVPRSDSAVKVYEQKNAIRKDATLGSYYITRQYFDAKMHSFEVKPTDIIISCAGTIGATYILPLGCEQGVINQALMRVRTGLCLDRLFFLYFFETILNAVNDSSNGSAMKNIPPFKIFKAFEIPVPSLAEQREVVARLDGAKARAEKLETKAQEGVSVCETMRKAILKEAFDSGRKG